MQTHFQHHTHTHSLPRSYSVLNCARFAHTFSGFDIYFHFILLYFIISCAGNCFSYSHTERIPAPILSRQKRSAENTSSTVSETITCEKRDVPHANHKTFHFICVCNNFLAGILGNSLEWSEKCWCATANSLAI